MYMFDNGAIDGVLLHHYVVLGVLRNSLEDSDGELLLDRRGRIVLVVNRSFAAAFNPEVCPQKLLFTFAVSFARCSKLADNCAT